MEDLVAIIVISAFINACIISISLYTVINYKNKTPYTATIAGSLALIVSALAFLGKTFSPGQAITASMVPIIVLTWSWWLVFKERKWLGYSLLLLVMLLDVLYGFWVLKINLSLPHADWPISYYIFLSSLLGIGVAYTVL